MIPFFNTTVAILFSTPQSIVAEVQAYGGTSNKLFLQEAAQPNPTYSIKKLLTLNYLAQQLPPHEYQPTSQSIDRKRSLQIL